MRGRNVVPFEQWAPDRSKLSGAAAETKGVLSIAGRFAPLPDLVQTRSGAQINDDCLGGFTAYDAAGNAITFLADAGRIYKVQGNIPTDVSRAGGYNASLDWAWSFCQFGNNILAITRGEYLQRYIIGSSSTFEDVAGAPFGDCVFRIRQHGFICDGNVVNVSAFNDITNWVPDSGTQAFSTELSQARGLCVSGWGGEQGVIFQERGMTRLNYTGGGTPFQLDDIEGGRGLCGPNAWSEWGRQAFCVAEDGFYIFDGLQAAPIGQNRVDNWFANSLNYSYRHKVWAAIDAKRKSWMVGFPTGGSVLPNMVGIYSFSDDRWTFDEIDTAYGFEMHREAISADDSAAIIAVFGTAVADDPAFAGVSADSPAFRESRKEWAIVTADRKITQFTGPSRAASLSTGVFEPALGRKAFVTELYPVTDAPNTSVTGHVAYRLRRLDEAETVSPESGMHEEGFCPVYAEGRYIRGIVNIEAGASWTEALGVQTDSGASGGR